MDRQKVDHEDWQMHLDKLRLKILMWLLVIVVCGMVACILLAIIKTAADILLVVAGICLVVFLVCGWCYHALKLKIYRSELSRQQRNT